MRLPLPAQFPDVELPLEIVATAVVTTVQTGLPGTEVHVILPNGYGLSLIHGRYGAYCTEDTVEALIFRMVDRDLGVYVTAHNTGIPTNSGPGLQGRADGAWLAATLTTLARL